MIERGATAPVGEAQISVPRRVCPLCDALVDDRLCPEDGMSTLRLDAPRSDPDRLQAGMLIAERYRIQRLIGTGGMAKVFSALHTGTGQNVALKVLGSGGGLDDAQALRRFFREARASAALRHPNTVRVFDFGQDDDGTVFLAMELLTGRTLRALLHKRMKEKQPFSELEALEIALAVCQSLAEAHSMGMVHRDIGPNNVFLHEVPGSDPMVKLLDFGLVKDNGQPLTRAHQLFGTVPYMSPEQVLHRAITPRSDLYSLGITMWWMMVGGQPFVAQAPQEVMWCHVHAPLPPLAEHSRLPVSADLVRIIERACAKDPDARFANALELKLELEACRGHARNMTRPALAVTDITQTFESSDTRMLPPAPLPERMPKLLLALCVTAMCLAIVAVIQVCWRFQDLPQPMQAPTPIQRVALVVEPERVADVIEPEAEPEPEQPALLAPPPIRVHRRARTRQQAQPAPVHPTILKERI